MTADFFSNASMEYKGGKKPEKWKRLHNEVMKILKYKKIMVDNAIYIKVLYDVTVSYPTVYTGNVLNTTNN